MAHLKSCPANCDPPDHPSMPSTEDRPAQCATITKTGSQAFAAAPDFVLSFDPVEFKIVARLNPVEVSYDGIHVHATLDAGRSETWRGTKRWKFWVRERSDATGGVATQCDIMASANQPVRE